MSVATHASTAVTFPVAVIEPPLSAYPIIEPNPLASVVPSTFIIPLFLATYATGLNSFCTGVPATFTVAV